MKKNILLFVGILCLTGCNSKPSNNNSRMEPPIASVIHPMYLNMAVPSAGIEARQNPPVLRWPKIEGCAGYEIRLSQDSTFRDDVLTASTEMAVYNPHQRIPNGNWYWQYRKKGGEFSEKYAFAVTPDAVPVVSPDAEVFISSIPKTHPRILTFDSAGSSQDDNADADEILREANDCLRLPIPKEADAYATRKLSDPSQQRKIDMDASQDLSSAVYDQVLALSQAYVLSANASFAQKAIQIAMEVSSWHADGITCLSDFGDARCMLAMALVYDTFHDMLDPSCKTKLRDAISRRADRFYLSWLNNIESKILSGHVWQHILHYFFQTAVAMQGETPNADRWLRYAYELFLARAPVLGGFDGGWVEGVSYFRMNMETMIDIPLIIQKFTGFDFINTHPWYRENIRWMIYHIPPGSSADGFGDNSEEVESPDGAYIAYAEVIARLTANPLAGWYAQQCRRYESPDLSKTKLLRWIRLAKTTGKEIPDAKPDPMLPMMAVFHDLGLASMHTRIADTPHDLAVMFKSSPFGSYGHLLCDQNVFNILYAGKRLFFRTGYKVTMDDPHRTGWYRTTKSQNGVLVDGESQPYGSEAFGWMARFMDCDEIAYVKGDATNAYKCFKPATDLGVTKMLRHIILLRDDLVLIYDELEANREVQWSWLIHSLDEMKIDTVRQTFAVALDDVMATGRVFHAGGLQWQLADTCDVSAVNWRESRDTDGQLKSYDAPQWHLKVNTSGKHHATRFLTLICVRPENRRETLQASADDKGIVRISYENWDVSAMLNSSQPPGLIVRNKSRTAAFSIYPEETALAGKKIKSTLPNASMMVYEQYGSIVVREMADSIPHAMANVLLYQKTRK